MFYRRITILLLVLWHIGVIHKAEKKSLTGASLDQMHGADNDA